MIRVILPGHLRTLAGVTREVELQLEGEATIDAVLNALEDRYPVLNGTIRNTATHLRRPFIRFFVCGEDWSHLATDKRLPEQIQSGAEPLRVVGAMAGG